MSGAAKIQCTDIIIIIIIHLHSLFGRVVLLTQMMSRFLERTHHLLLCVQLQPHFLEAQRRSDDKLHK